MEAQDFYVSGDGGRGNNPYSRGCPWKMGGERGGGGG